MNCDISDAKEDLTKIEQHFLEHLYRWEKNIPIEDKIDKQDFDLWFKDKKVLWKQFSNGEYSEIKINNKIFDFRDNVGINEILIKEGFFYHMRDDYIGKPSFLLAKIKNNSPHSVCLFSYFSCLLYARFFTRHYFFSRDFFSGSVPRLFA